MVRADSARGIPDVVDALTDRHVELRRALRAPLGRGPRAWTLRDQAGGVPHGPHGRAPAAHAAGLRPCRG